MQTMTAPTGKFIVDEPPMIVFRQLVHLFGLCEGHLLQQLHYWLAHKARDPARYQDHFIGGRYWVHWTMSELRVEVPFGTSSAETHRRVKKRLRERGVLLVEKHGAAWDQTDWYSIDYEAFNRIIAQHGGSSSEQSSEPGHASSGTPTMHRRVPAASIGGQAATHYSETENTQRTTTTNETVVVGSEHSREGHPGCLAPRLLLEEVPEALHKEVSALLAQRQDGQRFVDLLALALRRSDAASADKKLRAPILWLKKLLANPCGVDFTAADSLAEHRTVAARRARKEIDRAAAEAARLEVERAEQASRLEEARRLIGAMRPEELRALATAAKFGQVSRPVAVAVEQSILAGQLPKSPLAQLAVIKALTRVRPKNSSAQDGAT